MHKTLLAALALSTTPLMAQTPPAAPSRTFPAPSEIVAAAPAGDWVAIAPEGLLVMDLAPPARGSRQASANGKPHRVVIQLMPPPFSQGWVSNIRILAKAHWWDGLSINRVQDNYVAQWGDADGEDASKAKKLPAGLKVVPEDGYRTWVGPTDMVMIISRDYSRSELTLTSKPGSPNPLRARWMGGIEAGKADAYGAVAFSNGWPLGYGVVRTTLKPSIVDDPELFPTTDKPEAVRPPADQDPASDVGYFWPVHCYGMVGVGRGMSPDTGSGAELYTVIGHAPRHLDRNIALVGRVIEGIEHLSSLPRGTGPLGFYESADERVSIRSIRLGNEIKDLPGYEFLSTESGSFARYADARANRRDPFFIVPAGGADICNIPVPVRRVAG